MSSKSVREGQSEDRREKGTRCLKTFAKRSRCIDNRKTAERESQLFEPWRHVAGEWWKRRRRPSPIGGAPW